MRIESDRIIIRDLNLSDEIAFIEMASNGSLSDIFGNCSDCSKWMKNWINEAISVYKINNPQENYLAYAVIDKISNRVIGSVGCSAYDDLNEVGITYFIGNQYRKQGYASEAAIFFSEYFFEKYKKVLRLIATVRRDNKVSCKTVEKSGYKLKESKMYKDLNDSEEQWYNFYSFERDMLVQKYGCK